MAARSESNDIISNIDRRLLAIDLVKRLHQVLDECEMDLCDGPVAVCWLNALKGGAQALAALSDTVRPLDG